MLLFLSLFFTEEECEVYSLPQFTQLVSVGAGI